jgi:hypothetical protein
MGPARVSQPDLPPRADEGGHLAARKQSELIAAKLRAVFKSLR